MKHLPLLVLLSLMLVCSFTVAADAPAAGTSIDSSTAPASLKAPQSILQKGTCVAITYCDNNLQAQTFGTEMFNAMFNGQFMHFGEKDLNYLRQDSQDLFRWGPQKTSSLAASPPILCTDYSSRIIYKAPATGTASADPNVDTILIELWSPECGQLPQICTDYNGNIKALPDYKNSKQYVFVAPDGSSFYKGAGFYAGCENDSNIPNRAKILVAGNSREALAGAAFKLVDAMRSKSKSAYESKIRYYTGEDWANTAIVGFSEDSGAVDERLKAFQNKSGTFSNNGYYEKKIPTVVLGGSGLGNLADIMLNAGRTERWWFLPDRLSALEVITSADIAFEKLNKSDTNSLAYQLFVKLNAKSPKTIMPAKAYGCKKLTDPTSPDARFTASNTLAVDDTHLLSSSGVYGTGGGEIYVVNDSGRLYAGKNGIVCGFDGTKVRGSCTAELVGTNGTGPQTVAYKDQNEAGNLYFYCQQASKGGISGNLADYGVYYDDYEPAGGGKVLFMAGLSQCASLGVASAAGTNTPYSWFPESEIKKCSSLKKNSAGQVDCPYDETGYKLNGYGLVTSTYCGCAEVQEVTDWKEIKASVVTGGGGILLSGQPPGASELIISQGPISALESGDNAEISFFLSRALTDAEKNSLLVIIDNGASADTPTIESGSEHECSVMVRNVTSNLAYAYEIQVSGVALQDTKGKSKWAIWQAAAGTCPPADFDKTGDAVVRCPGATNETTCRGWINTELNIILCCAPGTYDNAGKKTSAADYTCFIRKKTGAGPARIRPEGTGGVGDTARPDASANKVNPPAAPASTTSNVGGNTVATNSNGQTSVTTPDNTHLQSTGSAVTATTTNGNTLTGSEGAATATLSDGTQVVSLGGNITITPKGGTPVTTPRAPTTIDSTDGKTSVDVGADGSITYAQANGPNVTARQDGTVTSANGQNSVTSALNGVVSIIAPQGSTVVQADGVQVKAIQIPVIVTMAGKPKDGVTVEAISTSGDTDTGITANGGKVSVSLSARTDSNIIVSAMLVEGSVTKAAKHVYLNINSIPAAGLTLSLS